MGGHLHFSHDSSIEIMYAPFAAFWKKKKKRKNQIPSEWEWGHMGGLWIDRDIRDVEIASFWLIEKVPLILSWNIISKLQFTWANAADKATTIAGMIQNFMLKNRLQI